MRVSGNPVLPAIAKGYIFIFRGSPLLIQMFLVFYGLGQFGFIRYSFLWPFLREPLVCAVLSLALCTAGYSAEIFRGGIRAVSPKEIEAARAIGMSGCLLVRRILAPIAFRHALPAYSTEIVLMMKSTALASLVTVWEVTGVAQRLISQTYRTMEAFLCAAIIYLVLNFIILQAHVPAGILAVPTSPRHSGGAEGLNPTERDWSFHARRYPTFGPQYQQELRHP